jgi:hypothetical protein
VRVCACVGMVAAVPVLAEQTPSAELQSAVTEARSAGEAGDYAAAFAKGLAAIETYPEAQWDRETLRAFSVQVGEHWFPRLSGEQKQSALAALAEPKSAAAKGIKAYALWRTKQRAQGLALLMPLIREHPDSMAADYAIRWLVIVQRVTFGEVGMAEPVKAVVQAAPNSPASAWAVCQLTWRYGSKQRLDLARKAHADMLALGVDGLAVTVTRQLASLLEALEAANYIAATNVLSTLRDYTRTDTPTNQVIDTFLVGIDARNPEASGGRIAALQQAFGPMAENDPDGERRCFADAILARLLELQDKKSEAADRYQRIVGSGVKTLEPFALSRIGQLCFRSDPERATAALERFRQVETQNRVSGNEGTVLMLGPLYLRQKKYAEGQKLYTWLLEQDAAGEFLRDSAKQTEDLQVGLAACLLGQGKETEGHALLDPILSKYGYGTPPEQLPRQDRITLATLFSTIGNEAEARKLLQGIGR